MKQRTMSQILVLIVFWGLIFTSDLFAKENSLKKGKWALQFEIDRDFDLSSFQGSTLSIKKQTADNRAYRFGLGIQFEYSDGKLERPPYGPGDSPGDRDLVFQNYKIDLQKLYYVDNSANVNLFLGIGPTVLYSYFKDKRDTRNDDDSYVEYVIYKNTSFSAGASGIIGVEWFVNKDISLLAEYGTSILYKTTTRESQRNVVQASTQFSQYDFDSTQGLTIAPTNVKFGLSVYF